MKHHYFIKFSPKINQVIGCQRATLILSILEYWSIKKPEGFYKFMEPCSHRLYKKGDSWAEELGCERRSFARSFKKIGVKYNSRMEFDSASDKFQGKMYASYYDRYTNRTFFIRNHTLADEFLKDFSTVKTPSLKKGAVASKSAISLPNLPLSTGQNGLSYIEAKNTSNDLSKDKSHAGNEIIKKMVDIWTAIVGEGKEQIIELRGKIIPFLRQALTDKFDNCLQQWKEYCKSIARSKFLMGEKTSFKATIEWALKFDIIAKILSGDHYGIGDRSRKLTPEELEEKEKQLEEQKKTKELEQQRSVQALEGEIKNRPDEQDSIKNFRIKWLHAFGEQSYREFLADSTLKVGSEETDLIIQPKERITAIRLESHWKTEILSSQPFSRVQVYHYIPDFRGKPLLFDRWLGDFKEAEKIEQGREESINHANGCDESLDEKQSAETNQLRARLKAHIPPQEYPAWLGGIKVKTINPDGILAVTFKDKAMSDYARIKFSEKILKSAAGIWGEVAGLMICEESNHLLVQCGDEGLEIDEKIFVEQAIQSLMGACFSKSRADWRNHR